MKRKRFTEEQIIKALKRQEAGENLKDICRELGVHEVTFYNWRRKFGGMEVSEAKRLRDMETENMNLKQIVADLTLDNRMLRDLNSRKW